ncbi:MAG: hypothetical protein AB2A00_18430 [Myxococcota bacterium]
MRLLFTSMGRASPEADVATTTTPPLPHAIAVAVAYLASRLPFLRDVDEYFDSPEYAQRVSAGLWHIFADGHFPHQALFLASARPLVAWLSPPLALNVASVAYGLLAFLAFHRLLNLLVPAGAGLVVALLTLLVPFVALCDLSGYSVSFNLAFFFLTILTGLRLLRGETSVRRALPLAGLWWFLAVSGHLLIGMWALAVPAVWVLGVEALDRTTLQRVALLGGACTLATAASLFGQAHFISLQFSGTSLTEAFLMLITRNGTGPYPLDATLLSRSVQVLAMQLGAIPAAAVLILTLFIPASPGRKALGLSLGLVGFLVSSKLFHWGLLGRVIVPGTFLLILAAAWAAVRLKPMWQGPLVLVLGAQLVASFLHVVGGRQERPFPLGALRAEGQRLAQQDPRALLVTTDRTRTFSGFPDERRQLYETAGDDDRLRALLLARQRGEVSRVLVDSQAWHWGRWVLDGFFYTWSSTFTGVGTGTGSRSQLREVLAETDHRPVTLLPGRQFIMALGEGAPSETELLAACRPGVRAGFVRAEGLTRGAQVEVYSSAERLSPLRLDAVDAYMWMSSRAGGFWDPLGWSYAGPSGVAVVVVFDPPPERQVYVDRKPWTEHRWLECPQTESP